MTFPRTLCQQDVRPETESEGAGSRPSAGPIPGLMSSWADVSTSFLLFSFLYGFTCCQMISSPTPHCTCVCARAHVFPVFLLLTLSISSPFSLLLFHSFFCPCRDQSPDCVKREFCFRAPFVPKLP